MTTSTQTQRVLSTLQNGKSLTAAQARTRGINRLSARIFEIRSEGHNVLSVPYTNANGNTAVKYVLATKSAKRSNIALNS